MLVVLGAFVRTKIGVGKGVLVRGILLFFGLGLWVSPREFFVFCRAKKVCEDFFFFTTYFKQKQSCRAQKLSHRVCAFLSLAVKDLTCKKRFYGWVQTLDAGLRIVLANR